MNSFDASSSRKRTLSTEDEPIFERKRPRVSSMNPEFQAHLTGQTVRRSSSEISLNYERLPSVRPLPRDDSELDLHAVPHRLRPLRGRSSYPLLSRPSTPLLSEEDSGTAHATREGLEMMRKASLASIRSSSESTPTYHEFSAKHHLRNSKTSLDFSAKSSATFFDASPISWSPQNVLVFGRANRVHFKSLTTHEDVGQLCKLEATDGDLGYVECAGSDQPNVVAVGTFKGSIQIWDIASKKMTLSWSLTSVTSVKWNGPVLTIGGLRGTIRRYDTRVKPAIQKEEPRKGSRHHTRISCLAWSVDGSLLASGDESGTVYCWDSRQPKPLKIGDFTQRRKKMKHAGVVRALAWCPWQPKLFASGDATTTGTGSIRLWDVSKDALTSNAGDTRELNAQVTSLHFSAHCKELLSTHGPGLVPLDEDNSPARNYQPTGFANSVVIHSVPRLHHVVDGVVSSRGIEGSVLNPSGTKVVLAIPDEKQIRMWDVWGKTGLRRLPSFMDRTGIR